MDALVAVAVPLTTFLLLLAAGLELTIADFMRVRRQRALVVVGLLAPLVLLPLIAIALTRAFQTSAAIAAGVLLISACPIGSVANVYCYMARASTALAVALTGLSALAAGVTVPLVGRGLEVALGQPFALRVPFVLLVFQLVALLVVPVMLGMWLRNKLGDRRRGITAVLQRLAVVGILFVFVLVILNDWAMFVDELSTTVPLAIAFVIASTAAGWLSAAFVTTNRQDRFAIAAGFGARNVAVATAMAVTILGQVAFARFAATYAFVEVPLLLAAVGLFRKWAAPATVEGSERYAPGAHDHDERLVS